MCLSQISDYKKIRKKMPFKETLTEWFFNGIDAKNLLSTFILKSVSCFFYKNSIHHLENNTFSRITNFICECVKCNKWWMWCMFLSQPVEGCPVILNHCGHNKLRDIFRKNLLVDCPVNSHALWPWAICRPPQVGLIDWKSILSARWAFDLEEVLCPLWVIIFTIKRTSVACREAAVSISFDVVLLRRSLSTA